jgi:hypothetical protein
MFILGFDFRAEDQTAIISALPEVSAPALVEAGAMYFYLLRSVFNAANDLLLPVILGSQHKLSVSIFDVYCSFHKI